MRVHEGCVRVHEVHEGCVQGEEGWCMMLS